MFTQMLLRRKHHFIIVAIANLNKSEKFVAVHEGRKPFKCDVCNSNFAHKGDVTNHRTLVHDGKRSFKCDVCNAAFGLRYILTRHIASLHV